MKAINITAYTEDASKIEAIKAFIESIKIKYTISKIKNSDDAYNAEFVEKIQNSRKQAAEGKTVRIDLDDIWK